MHPFWEKIEKYNTHLIPFALIALFIIIIIELFVHVETFWIEELIHIVDYVVITIFIVDLIFLAIHSKNTRSFFKNYWLDVIAIFPLGLLFTTVERAYVALVETERLVIGQAILHETLEVEKIAAKEGALIKEGKLLKVLKIFPRFLRLITKSHFFQDVTARHHKARRKIHTKKKRR